MPDAREPSLLEECQSETCRKKIEYMERGWCRAIDDRDAALARARQSEVKRWGAEKAVRKMATELARAKDLIGRLIGEIHDLGYDPGALGKETTDFLQDSR